jgi:hypothetical protein
MQMPTSIKALRKRGFPTAHARSSILWTKPFKNFLGDCDEYPVENLGLDPDRY